MANFREEWKELMNTELRVTNVKQPWAAAIMTTINECGTPLKNFENRTRHLDDRTWIFVVASKTSGSRWQFQKHKNDVLSNIREDPRLTPDQKDQLWQSFVASAEQRDLPHSMIIGAMLVTDSRDPCFRMRPPFSGNRPIPRGFYGIWRDTHKIAWKIDRVIPFDNPLPYKGCQTPLRFYKTVNTWTRDLLDEALLDQLEKHNPSSELDG
jgi:hypothetical protein